MPGKNKVNFDHCKLTAMLQGLKGEADKDNSGAPFAKNQQRSALKEAQLCRGFKNMYAKPGREDPVNRPSPQEQVVACKLHHQSPSRAHNCQPAQRVKSFAS